MVCILYVITVGALLGIAGLMLERTLPPTASRRWIWCLTIAASVTIPPVYQARHKSSIVEALGNREFRATADKLFDTSSVALLDPEWWASTKSYESVINPAWVAASAVIVLLALGNIWRVSRLMSASRRQRNASHPVTIE